MNGDVALLPVHPFERQPGARTGSVPARIPARAQGHDAAPARLGDGRAAGASAPLWRVAAFIAQRFAQECAPPSRPDPRLLRAYLPHAPHAFEGLNYSDLA
jgi:hypothetical protein